MRVKKMVTESFSGDPANPGAMTRMMTGDKNIPAMVVATSNIESSLMADLANSKASSFPWFDRYSVKTGINDTLNEPSAKSLRIRLGIRKATKKASELSPAPKLSQRHQQLLSHGHFQWWVEWLMDSFKKNSA